MITNLLTIMISIFLSIKLSGCRGVVVACSATTLEVVSSNQSSDEFFPSQITGFMQNLALITLKEL